MKLENGNALKALRKEDPELDIEIEKIKNGLISSKLNLSDESGDFYLFLAQSCKKIGSDYILSQIGEAVQRTSSAKAAMVMIRQKVLNAVNIPRVSFVVCWESIPKKVKQKDTQEFKDVKNLIVEMNGEIYTPTVWGEAATRPFMIGHRYNGFGLIINGELKVQTDMLIRDEGPVRTLPDVFAILSKRTPFIPNFDGVLRALGSPSEYLLHVVVSDAQERKGSRIGILAVMSDSGLPQNMNISAFLPAGVNPGDELLIRAKVTQGKMNDIFLQSSLLYPIKLPYNDYGAAEYPQSNDTSGNSGEAGTNYSDDSEYSNAQPTTSSSDQTAPSSSPVTNDAPKQDTPKTKKEQKKEENGKTSLELSVDPKDPRINSILGSNGEDEDDPYSGY